MKREMFWTKGIRVLGEIEPEYDPDGNKILPQCLLCTRKTTIKWGDKYSTFYLCIMHSKDMREKVVMLKKDIKLLGKLIQNCFQAIKGD